MWKIMSLMSFFLLILDSSGIESSSLLSDSESILANDFSCQKSHGKHSHLCENSLMASVSLMLRHFPYSSRMELGGLTASWDLITCSCHECHHAGSRLCGGMLTGSEVPDQKSVIRFRLTMSLSALPRSSREEERPGLREADSRATQIGALTLSAAANTKFSTKKIELTIKGPFTSLVFSL